VDCYNPKVIQASMGSIVRVRCHYVDDIGAALTNLKKPIYGATAKGDSIYKEKLPKEATYIFGSESHGISTSLSNNLNGEFAIPSFRKGNSIAESLNVANASAIFLSELFRSS
jgi:TrmH family RNA methyltransferase